MKRTRLLNSELSYEISRIGHTAAITLCDAGLPIPKGVKRIDLAIERGCTRQDAVTWFGETDRSVQVTDGSGLQSLAPTP